MASPASPVLSQPQLATLARHGEERTAAVGDVLFRVGDRRYPFIAILEGEAAILDAAGHEIVRHGASGFLGEMNLLSGQTVYLTGVVTEPMRYIAVDRDTLRLLLFEDGPVSDLLLSTFMDRREALQQRQGVGWRSSVRALRTRRGTWSSSRGAIACPTRGAIPSTPRMRRPRHSSTPSSRTSPSSTPAAAVSSPRPRTHRPDVGFARDFAA